MCECDKKSLEVRDQAKCPLTEAFKNSLTDLGCELIYIPARLTGNEDLNSKNVNFKNVCF